MRHPFIATTLISFVASAAFGADSTTTKWNGYDQVQFAFENRSALLVQPKQPADGKPWIWRTEFFGHEPQADVALLAAGWHVAYLKVSDLYGAPVAIEAMAKFHDHLVKEHGLAKRAVLEGFSRGGLYAVNYAAAHPDHTAALYLDAPVLDIRSWPGGKGKGPGSAQLWQQCLALYGLTEQTAQDFKGNPIDHATALAKAGIPVISVCGDADEVVPLEENTKVFEDRYRAAGGKIEVILKPGVKHHPHSLKDPKPITDFILQNALKD
jgi:pimeloyl-ACP methyl ester carboxylesterase